jgi:glycosyltransferase involved in cell wall biosynthesis
MGLKKILWFNWRCWLNPEMGGAEVFTHEVAKRWVELGHEVTLFTSNYPGAKKKEIVDGINIVRDGGRFSVYKRARRFYDRHFRKEGFDVVIDEINTVPFLTPKFVRNGEKVFALIHQLAREYWFYEAPFPISYMGFYFLEKRWLRQYVDVPTFTVSESTRKDLEGLGFKDLYVLPEGLNFEPLKLMPEKNPKPIVAFSGRLRRAKRPDHAIRAFKIVKEKVPDAELWILGDGPIRKELEQISGPGVRFFGNAGNETRRESLRKSWVLLSPGLREGWGLNVTEANALAVPAIAYNVPGLCDSVRDCVTGLLAKPGNIEDLATKTINILMDPRLRERLSRNALEHSRRFRWEKTADTFMARISVD